MKKYEFTGLVKEVMDVEKLKVVKVKQIRAIRDFREIEPRKKSNGEVMTHLVKTGQIGGWIESEDNLSHNGDCWISPEAVVLGNARVREDAIVHIWAKIMGNAIIKGCSSVGDYAKVSGNAVVNNGYVHSGDAISKDAEILDGTHVVGVKTLESSFVTFYRTKENSIRVCECVKSISIDKYINDAIEKHGADSKITKVRRAAAELARIQILG